MRALKSAAVALGACSTLVVGAPIASADGPVTQVDSVPSVIPVSGDQAFVTIAYSCDGTGSNPPHAFIAVKQGPHVNATDHTSSQYAKTFYSTNWSVDQGPNALVCDGTTQTQTFQLQPDPNFNPAAPPLHSGPVFLQVCIFDTTTQAGPESQPSAASYTMERALAQGGRSGK